MRVTNALGRITTSVFDAAARLKATMDALGGRTTYGFDAPSPEPQRTQKSRNPFFDGTSSENGTRIGTKSGTIPVKEIGKDTIYLEISSKETKQILP